MSRPDTSPVATRIVLTIDVALHPRPRADGWKEAFERGYEAAGVGVPEQLRLLARNALKACFFIDPTIVNRFGIAPLRAMVGPIVAAGQEVQLRLALSPDQSEATQSALIARARGFLVEAGAPEPVAFRTAASGANDATLRALASLGLRFDSSHGDGSGIALPADHAAPIAHQGVVELPVTRIAGRGGSRPLRIASVSLAEMVAAIEAGAAQGLAVVTIASEAAALANRSGTAPNRLRLKRFEGLCAWLSGERRRLPTSYLRDLGDIPLDMPSVILPTTGFRRVGRLIEQLWSDRIAEWRA